MLLATLNSFPRPIEAGGRGYLTVVVGIARASHGRGIGLIVGSVIAVDRSAAGRAGRAGG